MWWNRCNINYYRLFATKDLTVTCKNCATLLVNHKLCFSYLKRWIYATSLCNMTTMAPASGHDNFMTRRWLPHYKPFVRGIHRWPMDSISQRFRNVYFERFLYCLAWTNCWLNSRFVGVWDALRLILHHYNDSSYWMNISSWLAYLTLLYTYPMF